MNKTSFYPPVQVEPIEHYLASWREWADAFGEALTSPDFRLPADWHLFTQPALPALHVNLHQSISKPRITRTLSVVDILIAQEQRDAIALVSDAIIRFAGDYGVPPCSIEVGSLSYSLLPLESGWCPLSISDLSCVYTMAVDCDPTLQICAVRCLFYGGAQLYYL